MKTILLTHTARYPHVYGMDENMTMTLCLQGEKGAAIDVLVDGKEAGTLRLEQALFSLSEMHIPLRNEAGEHEITLRMTGRVVIDWFRLDRAHS